MRTNTTLNKESKMTKKFFSKNQLSILCELIFNNVHTADILYIISRKNREPECYKPKKYQFLWMIQITVDD